MSFETRDYKLDNSTIQQAVADIEPFLEQEKVDKKNALRLRFSLEELLLRIQDSDTAPETFQVSVGRRFWKPMILLRYAGGAFDPTADGDDEEAVHLQILNNLGLMPEWSCHGSKNTVRLNLPKGEGMNTLLAMLLAAIAALVAAGLGTFLPDAVREGLNNYL